MKVGQWSNFSWLRSAKYDIHRWRYCHNLTRKLWDDNTYEQILQQTATKNIDIFNKSYTGYLIRHGTHMIANNSTNNNVVFFFVSDMKILYYDNY